LWDLLVVDNASSIPLAPRLDLAWHPQQRVVREEKLGLTHARLRGIAETNGDVLVFVDDDNVLDEDYLEQALVVAEKHPRIGSWSGDVHPIFEQPPPDWTRPYWVMHAIREVAQDQIGATPYGAGLCIRRPVAVHYCQKVMACSLRLALGRNGCNLVSAEDADLARCALDLDLEMGVFAQLRLKHLIPVHRLTEEYLLRLVEAMEFSNLLFAWLNSPDKARSNLEGKKWILKLNDSIRKFSRSIKEFGRLHRKFGRKKRFYRAKQRGIRAFHQILPLLQDPASHLKAIERIRDWDSLVSPRRR